MNHTDVSSKSVCLSVSEYIDHYSLKCSMVNTIYRQKLKFQLSTHHSLKPGIPKNTKPTNSLESSVTDCTRKKSPKQLTCHIFLINLCYAA